jgi:hypothetical protein
MRHTLLLLLLLILLCATLPAQAAPILRLEASVTRTEAMVGERFTITTHLFNDGDAPALGMVLITDDGTLLRLSPPYDKPPSVAPGTATPFSFSYQVLETTPVGLHTFTLRVYPTGEARQVVIRVQPVSAPPAIYQGHRLYLPVMRH